MTDKELVNAVDAIFKSNTTSVIAIQSQLREIENEWGAEAVRDAVISCAQLAYLRLSSMSGVFGEAKSNG